VIARYRIRNIFQKRAALPLTLLENQLAILVARYCPALPFTTQNNADASKCFKWRNRGANKIYWWMISGKCLRDKYQKYNFIGEDCKAKCAKTWKLVQNIKSVKTVTFESKFAQRIGFIVKAWCSMSSVGLIHYNKHDEMFRYKNDRHHLVGVLQCNRWNTKKLCSICAFMLRRKNCSFSTWSKA